MSSNQQNLTIGSIRLKSDYMVVKISLTTGLGSDPALGFPAVYEFLKAQRLSEAARVTLAPIQSQTLAFPHCFRRLGPLLTHFSGSMLESKGKETCRQRNGCRLIVVIGSVIVAVNDCQVRVKLVG